MPADAGPLASYEDALLIAHFEMGRTDLDGAYFTAAGGTAGTISPLISDVEYADSLLTENGYQSFAIEVTGSAPLDGSSYAALGIMMLRGGSPYDASAYDGISFYARAAAPMHITVGSMQPNDEPSKGSCIPDVTCYNRPSMGLDISTTWQRYVVPFVDLHSEVRDGSTVPFTPSAVNGWVFTLEGTFDFYLDEMYFVKASNLAN